MRSACSASERRVDVIPTSPVTDCSTLIETGWNDHAERPAEVAERLAGALGAIASTDDALAFARLAAHVYGEHLGRFDDGIALLERIAALPAAGADAPAAALRRHVATLRFASGDVGCLAPLAADDRVAVLALGASTLAGRGAFGAAIAAYREAIALAAGGLPAGSPALRALAAGGNNLAAALEEKPSRDAGETQGMVEAAEGGLRYWKQAGTWLEEERAEYRLAKSLLQARRADDAVVAARRCLDVCERNDAPAFERFFGFAALAAAQRAAGQHDDADAARASCRALFDALPPDERPWCEAELRALA